MRDRDGLTARIRQIRRVVATPGPGRSDTDDRQPEQLQALDARLTHLEQLVEGLQDSVHREAERHEKLIAELQAQMQPGAMGEALAKDARDRGL